MDTSEFYSRAPQWFTDVLAEFGLKPIEFKRRDRTFRVGITGYNRRLVFYLKSTGIGLIYESRNGSGGDTLFDVDVWPKKEKRGVYCGSCMNKKFYKDYWALWVDHQTKPLRDFLRDGLLQSDNLIVTEYLSKNGKVEHAFSELDSKVPGGNYLGLTMPLSADPQQPEGKKIRKMPLRMAGRP